MPLGPVRVLDLDGSVMRQKAFIAAVSPTVVPLRDIGRASRLWADSAQANAIRASLDPAARNVITFFGSGDFHFVSALLLERFHEPLTVVVFDHHPDWDILPPFRGCGSWVSRALELRHVIQVVLIGNASDDLAVPSILTSNLSNVRNGRLALYPYEVKCPKCWPWNKLRWRQLSPDPLGIFDEVILGLPTSQVYVSIDKDCLSSNFALTNWEEGRLSLDLLVAFLQKLSHARQIVGADITGEYSCDPIPNLWKAFCSRLDHPKDYSARGHSLDNIDRINGSTNQQILFALMT